MSNQPVSVIEFDFTTRQERPLPVSDVGASCQGGRSCWIDIDVEVATDVAAILTALGINPVAVDAALTDPVGGRCDVYEECLHVAVGVPCQTEGKLSFSHVDIILGERFIITLRRGTVAFIEQVRRGYRPFFVKFAETLGFLLFELWDNLIDTYRKSLLRLEDDVERIQSEILGEVDDAIFNRVGEVTHDLLLLRKNILADREVLEQLALRKSDFVSPTTQPYLANMAGTLERLGDDLTTEREILAELLTLYLGIVSHRTNRVVNRLTVLSVIFLPLTFLCGVYGMNFQNMPEFEWTYGPAYFWALAVGITCGLLGLMRWQRWV